MRERNIYEKYEIAALLITMHGEFIEVSDLLE